MKLHEKTRRAIDKGANVLETEGYEAFLRFLSANIARDDARLKGIKNRS